MKVGSPIPIIPSPVIKHSTDVKSTFDSIISIFVHLAIHQFKIYFDSSIYNQVTLQYTKQSGIPNYPKTQPMNSFKLKYMVPGQCASQM